ncbi:MAG: ATP-binding protein, partial [Peptostreptococcaceae bacterium]|nr:ATP-binding protein [Peptostreptococcaceae bacterium]
MPTIEQIYQTRRDAQARALDLRIEKLYARCPDLEETNRRIRLKNLELSKSKLYGEASQSDLLAVELIELQRERDRLLEQYRIDPNELRMQYFCELCKDRGYLESEGTLAKCSCMLKIQEDLRFGQAHLSSRIEKENFSSFDLSIFDDRQRHVPFEGSDVLRTERENILIIRRASERFVREIDKKDTKSLFFYGPVGLGKSFMCSSIAKALFDQGRSVLYFTMNEFVDMMQLYHFDRDLFLQRYSMEDYFALERVDLLILDDLGTELTNSFVKTILFNVINARMVNRKKMVISTNLAPDEVMARYDERISSRLMEYTEF